MMPDPVEVPCAAAIADDGAHDLDALLASVVAQQRQAGRRVRGLLMTHPEDGGRACARPMVLVDLHTGERFRVSQDLGRDATACRADPQGFARASGVLRRALDEAPDLAVCNRFGGLEAEGGGFAAELLQLMAQGIPLLTAVRPRHAEAWQRFSGGAPLLAPEPQAIERWLQRALPVPAA